MLKFLLPLALFAAIVAFLAVGLGLNPREVPSPLIGKPAPAFALPRLDDPNQKVSREDLLGQVWMLNVWASWCAPCREEHPLVIDIARRQLVPVYGLNYKDAGPAARSWLASLGNPYRANLVDADGRVGIDFGVYGVPETFIIDRQGVIRLKHVGALTPDVVRKRIEPLLKELNAGA
ncbi:MAG: DsbE family thiol:disulfide interchange protein [Rubrivivax sp.]|nr:DsbE family thiol:disulfide interchange protein [Rubrivivax sp.]MDP3224216.1 DsbE family thiol:disulfide interchange protein [Rubrivivax sp.]